MFSKKKKCRNCEKKIDKEYEFCPYCGSPFKLDSKKYNSEEGWGMLGKNDFMEIEEEIKLPRGFNIILNSLMKNLEKQFKELDKDFGKNPFSELNKMQQRGIKKDGVSISIMTSEGKAPEIRVNTFGNPEINGSRVSTNTRKEIKPITRVDSKNLSEKNIKKMSKLPRKEPSTKIRRLSNKLIYEIEMPGVKSLEDVSIIKLENSIEIKALAKDKVYFKLIPISYPLTKYSLSDEKLILELDARE